MMPTIAELTQKNKCRACGNWRKVDKNNRCGSCRVKIKRMNDMVWSSHFWAFLIESNAGRCYGCGKQDKLTIDHIVPLTVKWDWNFMNLQPLCHACNNAKANQTIDYRPKEMMELLQLLSNIESNSTIVHHRDLDQYRHGTHP